MLKAIGEAEEDPARTVDEGHGSGRVFLIVGGGPEFTVLRKMAGGGYEPAIRQHLPACVKARMAELRRPSETVVTGDEVA